VWQKKNTFGVLWGNLKGRDHFEDLGLNDWMTLDENVKKEDGECGLESHS
jgi:hypothetical protein